MVLVVKKPPTNAGDSGLTPGSGRSPGGGNDSILAWRIPWTEEPGRLRSMGSRRVRHAEGTEHTHIVMFRNITDIIISLAQQPLKTSYHT